MSRLMSWLKGSVLVEVCGPEPERFLNLCVRSGAAFSGAERVDADLLRLRMSRRNYDRMAAENGDYILRPVKSSGAPQLLRKLKGRHVLLLAAVLCLAGLYSLCSRVWSIQVTGNETVATERILLTLEELGLRPGVKAASVDSYALRNSALLRIDELIWLSVNVKGCRAQVQVRERTARPEVEDLYTASNLVADKAGLITSVQVYSGTGLVRPGQTVDAGETLISGVLTNLREQQRTAHALGDIRARTWYTLEAQMPLQAVEKVYTGEKTVRNRLLFGQRMVNLCFDSGIPYAYCDKISFKSSGELFGLMAIPVKVVRETYVEYTPVTVAIPRKEAEALLEDSLRAQLASLVGTGEIRSTGLVFREGDGVLTAVLYAECLERIGRQEPLQQRLPVPENTER